MRRLRHRHGLSLAATARAAGTSESNVSAYERGAKQPNPATMTRLTAVIRCGTDSPIHRHRLVTAPAAAAGLRRGLRAGWTTADLLRVVREMRSNAAHLGGVDDHRAFYVAPSTTGDPRWDAMLAGLTEMAALEAGTDVPDWSRRRFLPHLWFVGSLRGFDAYSLAHTPAPLAVRGVVIDRAELESV